VGGVEGNTVGGEVGAQECEDVEVVGIVGGVLAADDLDEPGLSRQGRRLARGRGLPQTFLDTHR
jgi:hypothetical protein